MGVVIPTSDGNIKTKKLKYVYPYITISVLTTRLNYRLLNNKRQSACAIPGYFWFLDELLPWFVPKLYIEQLHQLLDQRRELCVLPSATTQHGMSRGF